MLGETLDSPYFCWCESIDIKDLLLPISDYTHWRSADGSLGFDFDVL